MSDPNAPNNIYFVIHKSTDTLLAVPCYSDLLGDQDDEDETERGQSLVMSRQGWRTEMVKWIGEARAAEIDEDSDNEDKCCFS
jgi:hypothetical protein